MELFHGLSALTWQQVVMVGVGLLLIYLATVKEYEPSLLLPSREIGRASCRERV